MIALPWKGAPIPDQGPDLPPDQWPDPDEWSTDFTARLNDSANAIHPSTVAGISGLLGSLEHLRGNIGR